MSSRPPESDEIPCDAPPYPIVRACRMLGFTTPEDVPWCHVRNVLKTMEESTGNTWKSLFGLGRTEKKGCACRQGLPLLERFTFTMTSGNEVHYMLGQCRQCHGIYWKEAW